jgi:hypothetical protein
MTDDEIIAAVAQGVVRVPLEKLETVKVVASCRSADAPHVLEITFNRAPTDALLRYLADCMTVATAIAMPPEADAPAPSSIGGDE